MKKFKWYAGRNETGYMKMLLAMNRFFDLWIIKYPTNSYIPLHVDPVDSGEHHRINIILKNAKLGGEFCREGYGKLQGRVIHFRPDIEKHTITKVLEGTRWVLSIGWIKP